MREDGEFRDTEYERQLKTAVDDQPPSLPQPSAGSIEGLPPAHRFCSKCGEPMEPFGEPKVHSYCTTTGRPDVVKMRYRCTSGGKMLAGHDGGWFRLPDERVMALGIPHCRDEVGRRLWNEAYEGGRPQPKPRESSVRGSA